jgi:hypothetical protein
MLTISKQASTLLGHAACNAYKLAAKKLAASAEKA